MNWLDITIFIVIAVSTVAGFVRGFIRELFAFGAIVLGLVIAYKFHGVVAPYLGALIGNPTVGVAASFILILILVTFGIGWMGRSLSAWTEESGFKPEDRRAGAMLGFIRGVLVVSFLLLAAATLIPQSAETMGQSTLGPMGLGLARGFVAVLPDGLKEW
jgi:membrane protein required for colicin V production